jgi:hypothetical protein
MTSAGLDLLIRTDYTFRSGDLNAHFACYAGLACTELVEVIRHLRLTQIQGNCVNRLSNIAHDYTGKDSIFCLNYQINRDL